MLLYIFLSAQLMTSRMYNCMRLMQTNASVCMCGCVCDRERRRAEIQVILIATVYYLGMYCREYF